MTQTFTAENLPPALEVGALITTHFRTSWFCMWDGSKFSGMSPSLPIPGYCDPSATLSGHVWRWATPAEMTAAGATPEQAQEWAHHSVRGDALWYPQQVLGFGPWVESHGQPIDTGDTEIACLGAREREERHYRHATMTANEWSSGAGEYSHSHIVAYCVRLSTPAEPQQAAAPQAAQEQADPYDPFSEVFAAIARSKLPAPTVEDVEMVERDGLPRAKPAPAAITPAPAFMLPDRSGLMVVADIWSPQ